jgi:hypothetical protein
MAFLNCSNQCSKLKRKMKRLPQHVQLLHHQVNEANVKNAVKAVNAANALADVVVMDVVAITDAIIAHPALKANSRHGIIDAIIAHPVLKANSRHGIIDAITVHPVKMCVKNHVMKCVKMSQTHNKATVAVLDRTGVAMMAVAPQTLSLALMTCRHH